MTRPHLWPRAAALVLPTLILLFGASPLLVGHAAVIADESPESELMTRACGPPAPSTAAPRPLGPSERMPVSPMTPTVWSEGGWRTMARGPIGTAYAPAVWTGKRLLVVDRDTGRTVSYSPKQDRWREVATAPRAVEPDAPFVWTGTRLIISDMARDASSIGGLAYDPAEDRWRNLARLPFEPWDRDHSITAAIWTGSHVVVAEGFGLVAAYDPAADCWIELGQAPGEAAYVWHLYQHDSRLLVESRTPDGAVVMRSFDLVTGAWSAPAIAPLDHSASETGGIWSDGTLVYVSWRHEDEYDGAANAVFDPSTMAWSVIDHDCTTKASWTIEAGDTLVASNLRRALDRATLACIDLPKPPRALNGTEQTVWTGSELIAWAGLRSLPERPRRGGLVFEPGEPAD